MTPDDFRARIANVTEAIRGHALNPELRSLLEASNATAGFSVDVVHMKDVKGPYHRHPKGEIDLVVPVTPGARFDGQGAGWVVYDPESDGRRSVRAIHSVVERLRAAERIAENTLA